VIRRKSTAALPTACKGTCGEGADGKRFGRTRRLARVKIPRRRSVRKLLELRRRCQSPGSEPTAQSRSVVPMKLETMYSLRPSQRWDGAPWKRSVCAVGHCSIPGTSCSPWQAASSSCARVLSPCIASLVHLQSFRDGLLRASASSSKPFPMKASTELIDALMMP
jgi:hypothetical protein